MKASLIKQALVAAAVLATFGVSSAQASDSVTVTVNATVSGVCKFFTANPTITVANSGGSIDPSITGNATGNVDISYRCSNGTTPTFTMPTSATVTCAACSGATMATAITYVGGGAGTGMGSGQGKNLAVTGTIPDTAYANAAVGAYTGTFTVSVTP